MSVRTLVVGIPHWPLLAAGVDLATPAAVFRANRVVAVTPAAMAHRVEVGMRRRRAQGLCPTLEVLDHDPDRDARAFEEILVALEHFTPRLEVLAAGLCSFPTRGPSRYFGGDVSLAEQVRSRAGAAVAGGFDLTGVGVADGLFAAVMAAGVGPTGIGPTGKGVTVVPPGGSATFLASMGVGTLIGDTVPLGDPTSLVDLLMRLGIRTLGDLASLPVADLLARFGPDGLRAHRLARGLDDRPPDTRPVPPEWNVRSSVDPPAQRVDVVAFVAKSLADELHARLGAEGVACTRLTVRAETEHGETHSRTWRHEGSLSPLDIADRVRWQMDGWLHSRQAPTAGISLLTLIPEEVVADEGRQLGFWGGQTGEATRAARALARVQTILGTGSVSVPEIRGGRNPAEQVGTVPLTLVDVTDPERRVTAPGVGEIPWPGRIPGPSPTLVRDPGSEVEVIDAGGRPVTVDGRGMVSAPPAAVRVGGEAGRSREITEWAGPWPVDERWWDPSRHRRRARFQAVLDDGSAHLISIERGVWRVEATYD